MAIEYIHIGKKIEEVLQEQHMTKKDLGQCVDLSQGNIVYLTKRKSIDVITLHKIGDQLSYNFFKHYPIVESRAERDKVVDERDKTIGELKAKVAELEGRLVQMDNLKKENGYLKEINDLLRKK
jgi:DNA-binding Xre family transcriptional regulator